MINTNLKTKQANFAKFYQLIKNQFDHGGDKYAHDDEKEWTDVICEFSPGECGTDWVLQTCLKYLKRFQKFQREKDLLKVAAYMYIVWLKHGFHLRKEHDEDTKGKGNETITINPNSRFVDCGLCSDFHPDEAP